jgi:hypothetical protein
MGPVSGFLRFLFLLLPRSYSFLRGFFLPREAGVLVFFYKFTYYIC